MPGFRRILAILRAYLANEEPPADPPDGMLYSAESLRAIDDATGHFRRAIRDGARAAARGQGRTMVEADDVRAATIKLMTDDVGLSWALGLLGPEETRGPGAGIPRLPYP